MSWNAIPLVMPELDQSVLLTIALYAGMAGLYLLIIPVALLYYLKQRWYIAGSIERLIIYGIVFVFFPGMLLLSPFLNFRPQKRQV